jgi:hypothetical protein
VTGRSDAMRTTMASPDRDAGPETILAAPAVPIESAIARSRRARLWWLATVSAVGGWVAFLIWQLVVR